MEFATSKAESAKQRIKIGVAGDMPAGKENWLKFVKNEGGKLTVYIQPMVHKPALSEDEKKQRKIEHDARIKANAEAREKKKAKKEAEKEAKKAKRAKDIEANKLKKAKLAEQKLKEREEKQKKANEEKRKKLEAQLKELSR